MRPRRHRYFVGIGQFSFLAVGSADTSGLTKPPRLPARSPGQPELQVDQLLHIPDESLPSIRISNAHLSRNTRLGKGRRYRRSGSPVIKPSSGVTSAPFMASAHVS